MENSMRKKYRQDIKYRILTLNIVERKFIIH